jgi:hypothetical protein
MSLFVESSFETIGFTKTFTYTRHLYLLCLLIFKSIYMAITIYNLYNLVCQLRCKEMKYLVGHGILDITRCGSKGTYDVGYTYCTKCSIYVMYEDPSTLLCYCCGWRIRSSRRSGLNIIEKLRKLKQQYIIKSSDNILYADSICK